MIADDANVENHRVVSHQEWLEARKAHLKKEKEIMLLCDELYRERRALPWEKVEKDYAFETANGPQTLTDLFAGRSQLVTYHFMLGPGWKEGCPGCSFVADHFDGANLHLAHHDVTLLAVSRAPLEEIQAFKKRMGWKFPWVSSNTNEFNYDFNVSFTPEQIEQGGGTYNYEPGKGKHDELPGLSVFSKGPDGTVYHTYSTYARGLDILLGTHHLLDMTPKGRNEKSTMDWMRHHDKYQDRPAEKSCCCE
jgi:predicted dithiol-disulfide oxidoreductase (DUF899 family)